MIDVMDKARFVRVIGSCAISRGTKAVDIYARSIAPSRTKKTAVFSCMCDYYVSDSFGNSAEMSLFNFSITRHTLSPGNCCE